jgi:hypothetical protein
MLIKIEGKDGLVRDMSSGAILNTNQTDYENYMNHKAQLEAQSIAEVERQAEINKLKNDVSEIKQMLVQLLNK